MAVYNQELTEEKVRAVMLTMQSINEYRRPWYFGIYGWIIEIHEKILRLLAGV